MYCCCLPCLCKGEQACDTDSNAEATDFTQWTDDQIKAFLDQRGEDYDDCQGRAQLVERASMCEYTTGPAKAPPTQAADEEEDPLDAFMAEINQAAAEVKGQPPKPEKDIGLDEEADNVADFMEARRRAGATRSAIATTVGGGEGYNSDEEVYATEAALAAGAGEDYDLDGNLNGSGKTQVGPLAPLDHESIDYEPFAKDFYTPEPEIAAMKPSEVNAMRRQLGIRVSGFDAPGPVETFEQLGLSAPLMGVIKKAGYQKPTAVQAQALPAALAGRNVLGIAKTGSGKTAAFVLPMLVHIQDQPQLEKGEGPIGIIVAPTRELAEQIHKEARKFARPYALRIAAGIGGLSKYEQFKDLKAGSDAAVCTPGRLIDLIKMKACTMLKATYLVFDEADRMFDMGFEPQVRSIIGQIRPDRQTLLFSATMPNKVERLVRDALTNPVRITVGELGAANEDIRQVVEVVEEAKKLDWLLQRLPEMIDAGEVLVFANHIARVDEIALKIQLTGHRVAAIHGDMDQHSRAQALKEFSAGRKHVLVATDVAARGLDIKSIKTVVNLDAAKDIDTHVHRIGRTGRAGDKDGTAYTLLTPKQSYFAGLLVNSLDGANQDISPELTALAMKDPRFRKGHTRHRGGGQFSASGNRRRQQVGGAGLGFGPSRADPLQELIGSRPGFTKGEAPGPATMPEAPSAAPPAAAPANPYASMYGGGGSGGGGGGAAPPAAPQSTPAASAGVEAAQGAGPAEPSGGGGVWGGHGLKTMLQGRFRSQFTTGGTTGGDLSAKPTIVAPKQAAPRQDLPPPPVPISQQAPPSQHAQQAIAAAQAIAARLSAGAAAGSSHGTPAAPSFSYTPSQPARGFGNSAYTPPQQASVLGNSASQYPDLSRGARRSEPSNFGNSASQHPDLSRGARRSEQSGSGFGDSASKHPDLSGTRGFSERPRGLSDSPTAAPGGMGGSGFTSGPGPGVAPYAAPVPQAAQSVQHNSIQSSIAAAQAIAARLAAGGGAGAPPPGPPRVTPVQPTVPDSVQASIEAARAIAARFGSGGGGSGGSQLGPSQDSSGAGQWAWGKG